MPNNFEGRDEMVKDLLRRMAGGGNLALSAEGQGGVGKTALAVALAHHRKVLAHFSDGVLWAGLGPQGDVMSALAAWGDALALDVSGLAEPTARRQAVRDAIGQRRLLLVIDDVWDIESAETLRCRGPNCCHLLTTRDKNIARAFAGPKQSLSVPTLEDSPAYNLLCNMAPEACQADPATTRALAQAVGGLPLALELLGGYLGEPEQRLLPQLSQTALEVMGNPEQRLKLAKRRLGIAGNTKTLREIITLSLAGLQDLEPGEKKIQVFYALGAFAPKPARFTLEAAEAVAETDLTTLAQLAARNLVEIDGDTLALHQVLADVARTRLDKVAAVRHRDYYLRLVENEQDNWHEIENAYDQIRWAWQQSPDNRSLFNFFWAIQSYQDRRGLWTDNLAWALRGLHLAMSTGWQEQMSALQNAIGHGYHSLGLLDYALEYYQGALHNAEESGEAELLATALNNVGMIYQDMGEHDRALALLEQSLPLREKVGDKHGLATTLHNLGLHYSRMEEWHTALAYYHKAVPIREAVGDGSGTALTLTGIGTIYEKLEQYELALQHHQRAFIIAKEVGDRAVQATTLNNIGMVYQGFGDYDKALNCFQRALPIQEELNFLYGESTTLNNMGLVYYSLKKLDQAINHFQRAASIQEEIDERYEESITRANLAMLFLEIGLLTEAVAEIRRAVELEREMNHPNLEKTMAFLEYVEAEMTRR